MNQRKTCAFGSATFQRIPSSRKWYNNMSSNSAKLPNWHNVRSRDPLPPYDPADDSDYEEPDLKQKKKLERELKKLK